MNSMAYLADTPALYLSIAAALGLMIGSFLNVVIHRLPIMLDREWRAQCREITGAEAPADQTEGATYNLLKPRSTCPSCQHQITALENIPLISYLFLKGRCRGCRARISPRYPLIELLTGLISVMVVCRFGFTPEAAAALVLSWALIALSGIDFDHKLLPDVITLPLVWAGLLLSLLSQYAASHWGHTTLFVKPEASIAGAAIGYLVLWGVYWLFKFVTGKEGMGYGDFKLLAALGAWLGYLQLPLIVIGSALVGAVTGIIMIVAMGRDRQIPIPFGPFLAAAGWVAMMWGERLSSYYLNISGLSGG